MKKKIGFIGCGNMGGALAAAVAKAVDPACLFVSDADTKKAADFAAKYGVECCSVQETAETCDLIFIGVKPQILNILFTQIGSVLEKRTDRFILVSMAAGVPISGITALAKKNYPVIRIMPNVAASVGSGMILYAPSPDVTGPEMKDFLNLMKFSGVLSRIDEDKIDAASCISGCGPAYVYLFIEALADGGVACGLPRDKALLYAAQTLKGSAEMLMATGEHPGKLKDSVCSPAGSTIEGVLALENGSFRADAMNAVIAAYKRTLELGK